MSSTRSTDSYRAVWSGIGGLVVVVGIVFIVLSYKRPTVGTLFLALGWASLVASDALVVPLQPEDFGAQGIADVKESIDRVVAGPNPDLKLLGYLITMSNSRLAVHKGFEQMLRSIYGAAVLKTTIPISTDFKEAIVQRKPVAMYKPRGAAAKVLKALADELFGRLAGQGGEASTSQEEAA